MAHGAAALSACKAAPQAAGALAKASTRALAKASGDELNHGILG
jgi:hypothetical protein